MLHRKLISPTGAEQVARQVARRLVVGGLGMSAVLAMAAASRAVIESPTELLGRRVVAGVLVVGVALLALALHARVVSVLERDGRAMAIWSAIIVVAFFIGGPGDELLLSAALGPIGVAGLVGRPRDALLCAVVVDIGYTGEMALDGGLGSIREGALALVAANCAYVLMTVAIIALPVRLGLGVGKDVATIVGQWRLDPASAPLVVRAARYPALAAGSLLTEQERRVVTMIGQGMYYEAIARAEREALGRSCSPRTVRKIVARIKAKTGAVSRAEIVALADPEHMR